MTRGTLLAVALCLQSMVAAVQAEAPVPLVIDATAQRVPIWQVLRVVVPDSRQTTPQQAAQLAAGSAAMKVDNPDQVLGRAVSPHWALFSLHNAEATEQLRLLEMETTTQFDIRLFERAAAGDWRQLPSLAERAGRRIGAGTRYPIWRLQLAPSQTVTLLLRVEGPAVVRFPVFVSHPEEHAERERRIDLLIGVTLGSCLVIGAYIRLLRRQLGDPSVPLFLWMLIANVMGALWLSGFLSEVFPALAESTLAPAGFAAYAILFGCGSLHARVYLNTSSWSPRADRLLQALGWSWLAVAPWLSLVFPVGSRILLVWGGSAIALVLVLVSSLAARRRVPLSGFIAAAWVADLLVGLAFLAARVAADPLPSWPSSALALVQATVITALFGLAMAQRLMRQSDMLQEERQDALMHSENQALIMRERTLLFAATNHDLRQPLLGVNMFAHLLISATDQAQREAHSIKLEMALREVDDLLVSIQQLATVYEASHQPTFEAVRLDAVLLPLIDEYRERSEYKQITIRYVPSRLCISTHVPYFQRIVRNVLSNAIRYTDRGDRILVGVRRAGGLRLVIADTGRGMTEKQTGRAFEVFERFDAAASIPDGFGLGLFSTKSLADALGLTIRLKSRQGQGTEFGIFMKPAPDA